MTDASEFPNECCGRCRFWFMFGQVQHTQLAEFTNGECQRHPPVGRMWTPIGPGGQQSVEVMQDRPTVLASDWCGEFERGPGRNGGAENESS